MHKAVERLVVIRAPLKYALEHAASVGVRGKRGDLATERVDDELHLCGENLDALLHNVVAVLVAHTLDNVAIKLHRHGELLGRPKEIEPFLHDAASVRLH